MHAELGEKKQLCCDKLVLGVTGSVGAAALPPFITLLRRTFSKRVLVLISKSGQRFLSPYVATIYSGEKAVVELFHPDPLRVPHIEATRDADVFVVMPATANILVKAALGIADEIISASILAAHCPVVFVPNMNEIMWRRDTTQEAVERLKKRGSHIVEPTVGIEIATLECTFGAMPDAQVILHAVLRALQAARKTTP